AHGALPAGSRGAGVAKSPEHCCVVWNGAAGWTVFPRNGVGRGRDTLADRIGRGPVPVEEALTIAHQITEALEAAHEKGVVHRDLKPANVKITPEGKVKVLDFGL